MALDVGDERIGVALSDALGIMARPYGVIPRVAGSASYRQLQEIVLREQVTGIVVGLPLLPSGEEGKQALSTRAYLRGLAQHIQLPVDLVDERYTTAEARDLMEQDHSRRGRDALGVDAWAAAVILQDYLSDHREDAR
ncbi:MAG: Holliday junction resolvase RuvX [Anaerolineae bacterium]|nr:Holliday junction resolvase RuvX [Chloroflexota bacterium]